MSLPTAEEWSAAADWVIAIANIVLFVLGFFTLRSDRVRIAKIEGNERRKIAEHVYGWIEERSGTAVRVGCRNGSQGAIYAVRVSLVDSDGLSLGDLYQIELMKPQEEKEFEIQEPRANSAAGVTVAFRDPAGQEWFRQYDGRLLEFTEPHFVLRVEAHPKLHLERQ